MPSAHIVLSSRELDLLLTPRPMPQAKGGDVAGGRGWTAVAGVWRGGILTVLRVRRLCPAAHVMSKTSAAFSKRQS